MEGKHVIAEVFLKMDSCMLSRQLSYHVISPLYVIRLFFIFISPLKFFVKNQSNKKN